MADPGAGLERPEDLAIWRGSSPALLLNDKGFVIYPGKVSNSDCFRIGTIGRLFERDIRALLVAMRATLDEMEITLSGD